MDLNNLPQGANLGGLPAQSGKEQQKTDWYGRISSHLTQDARERLNRVKMVMPQRAEQASEILFRYINTQANPNARIDDNTVVSLLDRISQQEQPATKLTFSRKHGYDMDDDEIDLPSKKIEESDDDFFD